MRMLPLLGLTLLLAAAVPTASWTIPSLPGFLPHVDTAAWQEQLLQSLWDQNKDSMSYCVGESLSDAKQLFRDSFPSPLPAGPDDDPICSNSSMILAHLCTPQELKFYVKYLLLTDNPEKLPSNKWCDVSSTTGPCSPGFFQPHIPAGNPAVSKLVPDVQLDKPHACCPGYICPSMLTCIIPCPLGAWCPRAWAWDPPTNYLAAASGSEDGGLLPPELQLKQDQPVADKWCAPYAYKMRQELGCGGADKWTIEPVEPFPRRWDWFSGNIFCNGGSYCPNTTTMLDCKPGHFCKRGSSAMTPCPPLLGCPSNTEAPVDNKLGFALNAVMLLLLAVTWQAMQLYNSITRRLSRRERMKIMWNSRTNAPEITVVEEEDVQLFAPPPTARQTLAGGHPSSSAGAAWASATATAAAAAMAEQAQSTTWLDKLPARFGSLGRAQLARRRSSRAGGASGAGDVTMTWASFDDSTGTGVTAPLLEYDMQGEELPTVTVTGQHRRTHSASTETRPHPHHSPAVQQQPLPSIKAKGGKVSPDLSGPDFISTGVYHTALSPASKREWLDSAGTEASAGARFFRGQRSNTASGDGGGGTWGMGDHTPAAGSGGGFAAGRVQLDVGFENLGLKLKSCGKVVLQGVTGCLQHGRLTAVMGPSGAGKTTLLTALAGRASYGTLTGKIKINGRPDKLDKHRRLMGFVPQSDIMYRNLTVEENLTYSACFRLPASKTPRQRLQVVAAAIDVLGLDDVRHQLIGNEEVRGISGGQVKRVNVGLELVAEPSLLFLDEPTSGLDSTASKLVVQCLQRVARTGVTVAAVIHQPSWETFCLFDDLILLAKGGLTAYAGPQPHVQGYFESLGFEMPAHINPADHYLDIIAGAVQPQAGQTVEIAASWRERQQQGPNSAPAAGSRASQGAAVQGADEDAAVVAIAASRRTSQQDGQPSMRRWLRPLVALSHLPQVLLLGLTLLVQGIRDSISSMRNAVAEQLLAWAAVIAARGSTQPGIRASRAADSGGLNSRPPGFLRQYSLVLGRAAVMRTREPVLVFIEYMIYAVTGMFVGLMSDRGRGSMASYVGNVVYTIVAMGMLSTISGVKVFGGPDRLVFVREASTGLNKMAYFWALDTWSYVGMVLRSAVYLIMYYTYSQPRAVVWQLYVVTCAIYYSCQGQAFLLSQVMGSNAAQLTAAVSSLINALVASKFSVDGVLGVMNRVSYARWGLEGYVIAEANCLKGVWLLARCADLAAFSYDVTQFWYAIKVLFYIGLGSRLAACLAMLVLHRFKSV